MQNGDFPWQNVSSPGRVNIQKANWKDPPCYQWENPLFRLGHFQ